MLIFVVSMVVTIVYAAQADLDFIMAIAQPEVSNVAARHPEWEIALSSLTTEAMCALPGVVCDGTWPLSLTLDNIRFSTSLPTTAGLTGLDTIILTNCRFMSVPYINLPSTLTTLNLHGSVLSSTAAVLGSLVDLEFLQVIDFSEITTTSVNTPIPLFTLSGAVSLVSMDLRGSWFTGSMTIAENTLTWLDVSIIGNGTFVIGDLPNLVFFANFAETFEGSYGACSDFTLSPSLGFLRLSMPTITQTMLDAALSTFGITYISIRPHGTQVATLDVTGIYNANARTTLVHLDLHNTLIGDLPADFGVFSSLTYLSLDGTHVTGDIPSTMGAMVDLQTFTAQDHHFRGTIPSTFANLIGLWTLNLESLWSSLGNECVLRRCDPSPLPAVFCNLTSAIRHIGISGVYTGSIPACVGTYPALTYLSLGTNSFSGSIPAALNTATNLVTLKLEHNLLTGALPTLADLGYLTTLDIHDNDLTGVLTGISALPIVTLDVSGNSFHGALTGEDITTCNVAGNCLSAAPAACTGAMTSYCTTTQTCLATVGSVCPTCDTAATGARNESLCSTLNDGTGSCEWCNASNTCGPSGAACTLSCTYQANSVMCNAAYTNDTANTHCAWCTNTRSCKAPPETCPTAGTAASSGVCTSIYVDDYSDMKYAWCASTSTCAMSNTTAILHCPVAGGCGTIGTVTPCNAAWSTESVSCAWCASEAICMASSGTCHTCLTVVTGGVAGNCTSKTYDNGAACTYCATTTSCGAATDVEITHCPVSGGCSAVETKNPCNAAWSNINLACAWCLTDWTCKEANATCHNCSAVVTGGVQSVCTTKYADEEGTICSYCPATAACGFATDISITRCQVASCTTLSGANRTTCTSAWANVNAHCMWCNTTHVCSNTSSCASLSSAATSNACTSMFNPASDVAASWCANLSYCGIATDTQITHCPVSGGCGTIGTKNPCNAAWSTISVACAWCLTDRTCKAANIACHNCSAVVTSGVASVCTSKYATEGGTACSYCATTASCGYAADIIITHCPAASCAALGGATRATCTDAWATTSAHCMWCNTTHVCSNHSACALLSSAETSEECTAMFNPSSNVAASWCANLSYCGIATDTEIVECPVPDTEPTVSESITVTQQTYATGDSDYDPDYNPVTTSYWINDPVAVKVDMEIPDDLNVTIETTEVYSVVLVGSALTEDALAAYGDSTFAEVFIRNVTTDEVILNDTDYRFVERAAAVDTTCAVSSACYTFYANSTKMDNSTNATHFSLNITTICKVTYSNGVARMVRTTESLFTDPIISSITLYPQTPATSGATSIIQPWVMLIFTIALGCALRA